MKPTKHCLKKRGGECKWKDNGEGELVCSRYTVYTYGIITMKSPCIINIYYFKNKIK
jgi:hypothetical protein